MSAGALKWIQLTFDEKDGLKSTCKPHVLPEELEVAIVSDLKSRGFAVVRRTVLSPTILFFYDPGGAAFQGEPTEEFQLDGLKLGCRSIDTGLLWEGLLQLEPRVALVENIQFQYRKLHGGFNCFVFNARLRLQLVNLVSERMPAALNRGSSYLKSLSKD